MRKHLIITILAGLIVLGFWAGSQPPSDQAIITIFQEHRAQLTQLVHLYQEDKVGIIVHKNGSIFPAEATNQLSTEHLNFYRALVQESDVTRSLWNKTTGSVTFQIFNPIPLPPIKKIVYSPITQPAPITSGITNDYAFEADQYHLVCRPIEADWYLCLDYED
jgi:hypothetical protein